MILAIDAGNSRFKWGLHNGDTWQTRGDVPYETLGTVAPIWHALEAPDQIIISNVAGEQVRTDILRMLAPWHSTPRWIEAKVAECGVGNGYREPAQLGADRWASLIAARNIHTGYCLVACVGTAMTVDVLSDTGKFMGGIIVPGPQLMLEVLSNKADGIGSAADGKFVQFPDNTSDAAYSGALQALAGAIERMHRAVIDAHSPEPLCILSGGAAPALQSLLNIPLRVVDNLVLEGLIRIAHQ